MRTLKLYISFCLALLMTSTLLAQQLSMPTQDKEGEEPQKRAKYVVPANRVPYIRIGVDPSRYLYPYIDGITRGGIEFAIDTELKGQYFPVVEIGQEFAKLEKDNYQLDCNGLFIRVGMDNNFLKYQDKDDRDMFFMGLRMAYSYANQSTENVIINNQTNEYTFNFPSENYNILWAELVVGVKTELAKNIFFGWTVRGKRRLNSSTATIDPYLVPGYGKYNNNFNVAANIYISYTIPFKKALKNIKSDG